MANRYHTNFPERKVSGGPEQKEKKGTKGGHSMNEKAVGYPGIPGKAGPDRSGGIERRGYAGPFNIKKEGFSG